MALDSDHVLNWKVAEFLNTTGLTIHMEVTFSQVIFRYVHDCNIKRTQPEHDEVR